MKKTVNISHSATNSGNSEDKRLFAPSSARNKDPILEILLKHAPKSGLALEVACGSGEHGIYFSKSLPNLDWQPSDIEQAHLDSVDAHRLADDQINVRPARFLDVASADWEIEPLDLIYNANMIHISPWACTLGLMAGAERHLKTDGILFMYGPYKRNGEHTAPSNASFDESLQSRDASWGIRDLEEVVTIAERRNLAVQDIIEMPANNLCVIYKRI